MRRRLNSVGTAYTGLSTPSVVQIVFLILKWTKLINWPWVWVLSPLWITVGLVLIAAVIGLITIIITRRT